jgi:hypothetical protein
MRFVPEKRHRLLGHMLDSPKGVMVAVRARKDDDAKFHAALGFVGLFLV